MSKPSERIIFLHLPKCGGSTFHAILNRIYGKAASFHIKVVDIPPDKYQEVAARSKNSLERFEAHLTIDQFKSLPLAEREKLKLLKGHMYFGLHRFFPDKSDYITFLRDPIERIISYYFYVKRRPNHRFYQHHSFQNDTSLIDFAISSNEADLHNAQIRLISGIDDKPELMLEKALENIENHFSFVGTLEKFDASLLILQQIYGWPCPYYAISNKTNKRPQSLSFPKDTIETIANLNAGDLKLYKIISDRLVHTTKATKGLQEKMIWLKTASQTYNALKNNSLARKAIEVVSTIKSRRSD